MDWICVTHMALFALVFIAICGLVFGSFLNVCITRLPLHQSVVTPRSRCPQCLAPIRASDNIPLLSWILLRGRCRDCHATIPPRYLLIEIALPLFWIASYQAFGWTVPFLASAILCFLLLGLAVMDGETMRLPDTFTLYGTAAAIGFAALDPQAWTDAQLPRAALHAAFYSFGSALAGATFILIIRWLYRAIRGKEGMGLGDAKLLGMIAAWLGLERTLLVFFLAVVGGAVFALGMLAVKPQRDEHGVWRERRVPFGTFLSVAALYSLFLGWSTIRWYIGLF